MSRMTRRVRLIALAVLGLVLTAVVASWPALRQYTGLAPPDQVDQPVTLDPSLASRYPNTLGVAHNAGNNPSTLAAALRNRAGAIEIDVIEARGRLVAGRPQNWPWLAGLVFLGPTLQQAWDQASAAGTVKLDLKQSDVGFLNQVVAFVRGHPGPRRVMISTDSGSALTYLRERLGGVDLLFSVSNPGALRTLQTDGGLRSVIAGASLFQGLVSARLVAWAHRRHLIVLAWTVNDGSRLNQLVSDGVDGITTANLAVLRALRP